MHFVSSETHQLYVITQTTNSHKMSPMLKVSTMSFMTKINTPFKVYNDTLTHLNNITGVWLHGVHQIAADLVRY